jgi:hypothetical protein
LPLGSWHLLGDSFSDFANWGGSIDLLDEGVPPADSW